MRRSLVGLGFTVLLVGSARADLFDEIFGIKPGALSSVALPSVAPLVEKLGSPDYREREKAGKDLLALGDLAIPGIREALKIVDDPEVVRRLQVLARTLENRRLGTARKVTFKVVNKPAKEILAEIARQTGYKLKMDGDGEAKAVFSFDFKDVSFWEALDKVCDAAGFTANQQDDDGTLAVYFTDATNPYTSYDGPFKIHATNVNSSRSVQLAAVPRRGSNQNQPESLNLNFTIQSEPKAPIVGVGGVHLSKAIDDAGATLIPFDPEAGTTSVSLYSPPIAYKSYAQSFSVNLARTDRTAKAIKEIRGKMLVSVLSETKPELVVNNLLKVKKERFAGRTAEVEVVRADWGNNLLTIELVVRQRNADPGDYSWQNSVYQRLEVFDANGIQFRFNGLTHQNAAVGIVSVTAQYTPPEGRKHGPPTKMQYVEWLTVNKEVSFAFKDVPLP